MSILKTIKLAKEPEPPKGAIMSHESRLEAVAKAAKAVTLTYHYISMRDQIKIRPVMEALMAALDELG